MSPKANETLLTGETIKSHYETRDDAEADNEALIADTEECSCDEVSYGIGDLVFASCIVAPLVVGVWRGGWGIIELHYRMFPIAQIFVLGIIIHICFALLRSYLFERSNGAWSGPNGGLGKWLRERVLCRIYTYCFSIACILHWRGGFGLFDALVNAAIPDTTEPHRPVLVAALTILCYVFNLSLRASRNLLAPPYVIVTDGKLPTYVFSTRFKKPNNKETVLYVLDCVFSVTVVGSLVVFVWRGYWELLDIYLLPANRTKSCWISLVAGYAVVAVTFSIQAPMRWAAARLHGALRLLLADTYHLLSFAATVNVWRGVWGLHDIYLFPDSPLLSNWCSHIVSFVLLVLLNCSNSIVVRGVYIDAEEEAGDCVVFPCHYLRMFFHKERAKKRHRKILVAAASAASRMSEDASVSPQLPEDKV